MTVCARKFSAIALFCSAGLYAVSPRTVITRVWRAYWIDAGAPPQDYGVYHFRRVFDLPEKPSKFVIHVSADNRFQLFVNGTRVAVGPARGDLTHWRYETLDISTELHAGRNSLAAVAWNEGPFRAVAQVSNQTGFVLDADDAAHAMVNTNRDWKCYQDLAYAPLPLPPDQATGYWALGPNESVAAGKVPWGWEKTEFDDSAWPPAHQLSHGADRDSRDAPNRWMLVESEVPLEEQRPDDALVVRERVGSASDTIPPHTTASILFDQQHLTTAYPELTLSNGTGARVALRYAEALFDVVPGRKRPLKSNRDVIEGKKMLGPADIYVADGGEHRVYRPLYWRTYRYLRLEITTADEPLTIEGLKSIFTAYPFERRATFAGPPEVQRILDTGWRTARLCAHETYMDCPFYEQLQYAGDARIQMLISLYMTGDARLMKNGIALLNSSRTAEGATYSRAPSALQQYIPPFSLWWIGMVHDYWQYVDDPVFVQGMLPGVESVLRFYGQYQGEDGSLGRMPWWNFVDWVPQWPNGEPPAEADGSGSAALNLQLLLAYQWAADLEASLGDKQLGKQYSKLAQRLASVVRDRDWDASRGLFADQPSHRTYSQHVNTLAVLAHIVKGTGARSVVDKIFADPSLAQSSIYFRAYTNAVLREAGLGDKYLEVLGPWREMLQSGLTTWAEWNGPDARSDCHAWGASPNFEMLRTIAGIEPLEPGFKAVRIAPNLGKLTSVKASMPHPKGEISVDLAVHDGKLTGTLSLPPDTPGVLKWHGRTRNLHPGENRIALQ